MLTTALRGIRVHARRLLRTSTAVVLGVAFLAGTLVLGDTMRAGFATAFAGLYAGTDVVVQGAESIGSESAEQRRLVPAPTLDAVAAVPGVDRVAGRIEGLAQVTGSDGTAVGGEGPPTIGENWLDDRDLDPMQLVEGRGPLRDGEVVIDRKTATVGGLGVGDTTTVRTPTAVPVTVVGVVAFGEEDSVAGSGYTAFTDDQARELLLGGAAGYTSLVATAADGVEPDELRDRVAAVVPSGIDALTGAEMAALEEQAIGEDVLDMFQMFLLVFTGVALLVAAFSIYNTFAVVLAQRTREAALLRAIGATRSQVLGSIVLETAAVGVAGSLVGMALGLGLAELLMALMSSLGIDLPGGLTVEPTSLAVAGAVGLAVTLVAGILPAVRASGVAPLAALRDAAVDHAEVSRARVVAGTVIVAAGAAAVVAVALAAPDGALAFVGLGGLACVVGAVVIGPGLVRPFARAAAAPAVALRGTTGRLAAGNAMRNPTRTSGTAGALMIGVAVVVLFTTVASSLSAAVRSSVTGTLSSDLLVVDDAWSGSGMSPALADEVGRVPGVSDAVGLGWGGALVDGEEAEVTVTEPRSFSAALGDRVVAGSLADLGDGRLAVSDVEAENRGWEVGSPVRMTFVDGTTVPLEVGAVYADAQMLAGPIVVSRSLWADHNVRTLDAVIAVTLEDGVGLDEGAAAVSEVTRAQGAPDAQTLSAYADDVAGEVNQLLGIVYALLALSIVIAVVGISNTLALSILERTRELGLLRAVGLTRAQTRSMVRWESVLVAVFGTAIGVAVGLTVAWGFVRGMASVDPGMSRFSAPVGQLVAITVLGGLVGVLASVRPASRAARTDVLAAVAVS